MPYPSKPMPWVSTQRPFQRRKAEFIPYRGVSTATSPPLLPPISGRMPAGKAAGGLRASLRIFASRLPRLHSFITLGIFRREFRVSGEAIPLFFTLTNELFHSSKLTFSGLAI
jgi:hypothetical protein